MEKMFGTKMKEFFSSISDGERNNLKQRMEKMAAMCPCMNLVDLGLKEHQILLFDAGISFLLFAQHSLMIRQSFRRFMERFIPESYNNAIYSVSSGIVLAVVLFLWQSSEIKIASVLLTSRSYTGDSGRQNRDPTSEGYIGKTRVCMDRVLP